MIEREIFYISAYFQKNILKHVHSVTHNIKVYQKRYNSGLLLGGNSSCERNATFHFQVSHELLLRQLVIPIFLNWHNFRTNERILTCKRLKFIRKKFLIDWSTYQCCNLNSSASTNARNLKETAYFYQNEQPLTKSKYTTVYSFSWAFRKYIYIYNFLSCFKITVFMLGSTRYP